MPCRLHLRSNEVSLESNWSNALASGAKHWWVPGVQGNGARDAKMPGCQDVEIHQIQNECNGSTRKIGKKKRKFRQGRPGIEPGLSGSKPEVIPLHYRPIVSPLGWRSVQFMSIYSRLVYTIVSFHFFTTSQRCTYDDPGIHQGLFVNHSTLERNKEDDLITTRKKIEQQTGINATKKPTRTQQWWTGIPK